MNFGPICIVPVKPRHSDELTFFWIADELTESDSIVFPFSHSEHSPIILQMSKVNSGIKLSDDLLVPIFLKAHKCLGMLALTYTYDLLK